MNRYDDPFVSDTFGGISANLREGTYQRLQAMYPWARTGTDIAEYFRDVREMRDWTMGGRAFQEGHGITQVPNFFKHNPEALWHALPVRQLAQFLGVSTYAIVRSKLLQPWLFEKLVATTQTIRSAYVMRELVKASRRLIEYVGKRVPGNPYEGLSGLNVKGLRITRKDLGAGDARPEIITLYEIARAMSRGQTNKLSPHRWGDAIRNALVNATGQEIDQVREQLFEMARKDDVEHIFGKGDYSEVDEMPYNRRTGQWYPSRRNYGFQRRRRYNNGGGYSPRRRTYRRSYSRW